MGEHDDPTRRESRSGTDTETQAEGSVGTRRRQERARDRLTRGAILGRYVVEERVGQGGMGVVYAAHDPELRRRVALKLLRPELGRAEIASDAHARLLREAQAMARLTHPNVIRVYDVGTYEDAVFLALEFVDGEHIGRWLKRTKPSWREVLRVFVAAGRGLAAAHAAGLVHRDFKPDNVLIGKDGRVLVMDFGLARVEGTDDEDGELPEPPGFGSSPPSRPSQPAFEPLTAAGAIIGTPGYAAPEHLDGQTGDARSDQFSFAASLYAGMYRKRPFPAESFAAYRKLLRAPPPEQPANSDVPARVRRAIERGLSHDPAARFASMDEFLDELSRELAPRRRTALLVGAGVAALGIAGGGAIVAMRSNASAERSQLCVGAERELAGVWDDGKRAAVKQAFLATERPYAATALAGATQRLDARARAWTLMYRQTCEATRIRGEQTEAIMSLRVACLDKAKREMAELVSVFAAADAKVVERAVGATTALSPIDDCADVKALLAAIPPPPEAVRVRVEQQRAALAHSKALFDAGKFKEAATVAQQVVDAAKTIDYRPLEAEALYRLGETQVYLQAGKEAVASLRAAMRAADEARYDEIRARALAWMVGTIGYDLEKPQDGLALAEDARAALQRIGGNATIEANLESSLGRTYSGTSDYAKMLEHHARALALRQKAFGEADPTTAASYNNVAVALKRLGRYDEALTSYQKAQAIRTEVLGAQHPDVAMGRANIGSLYYETGELEHALAEVDAALANARKTLPPTHGTILVSLANRGVTLADLGRYPEAQATYDELFAILNKDFAKSARMGRALAAHAGHVLVPTGKAKAALAEAEQARKLLLDASDGKPNDDVALAIEARGRAYEAQRDLARAGASYQEAIDIDELVLGHDDPSIIDMLAGLARVNLARKKYPDAKKAIDRGIAICEQRKMTGKWLADFQRLEQLVVEAQGEHVR